MEKKNNMKSARVNKLEKTMVEYKSKLDEHKSLVESDTGKIRGQMRFLVKVKNESNIQDTDGFNLGRTIQ